MKCLVLVCGLALLRLERFVHVGGKAASHQVMYLMMVCTQLLLLLLLLLLLCHLPRRWYYVTLDVVASHQFSQHADGVH
jgi:hypothetical protein